MTFTMAGSSNSRIPASSSSRYSVGSSSTSSSGGAGIIPPRSASTSTLPSIRSLRKAFQFGKHHSLDSQSNVLRRSTSNSPSLSSTRSFSSGTLSIPRPGTAPSTSNTKNHNETDKNVTSSPVIEASNAMSGSGTDPTSASTRSEDAPKNVNPEPNNTSSHKRSSSNTLTAGARPLSTQSISSSTAYSSSIPVNSRPTSISSRRTIQSISSRAELKSCKSSPPLSTTSAALVTTPPKTSPSLLSDTRIEEEEGGEMSIMHIRHASMQINSTPPPIIPLPPIPRMHSEDAATINNRTSLYTPSRNLQNLMNQPQNGGNRYSLDVPRTRDVSSSSTGSSLLDEPAPLAFAHTDDLSISSPPPPPVPARRSPIPSIHTAINTTPQPVDQLRPTVSRSRSAIDSIKAMADEVDILNNAASNSSSHSHSQQNGHGTTRSRQTSLPKPVIMESPSRSPAVTDANKMFNFPLASSTSRGRGGSGGGNGGMSSPLPPLSAEIMESGPSSSSATTSTFGSRSRSTSNQDDAGSGGTSGGTSGGGGLTIDSRMANTSSDLLNSTSYLRGVRRSATSPLSELVQRLNEHSPIKSREVSPTRDMDTSDIRSEEDPLEATNGHREQFLVNGAGGQPDSPFISQHLMEEEDETSNVEDASVDGSSGISAAPPSRRMSAITNGDNRSLQQQSRQEPGQSFERLSGRRVSEDVQPRSTSSVSAASTREMDEKVLREFESRISPQTEKRWSMAEVEAAYGRIRKLATRRSSAAVSEAPSFLISEDSKDMAPSYVQHLIDRGFPLDASIISSGGSHPASAPPSDVGSRFTTLNGRLSPRRDIAMSNQDNSIEEGDEAGDALTPLVGRERYSPSTSPRVSPRALSPHAFAPFPDRSPRNSYLEDTRTDSPHSSAGTGTGSSGHSRGKSNGSAALTAPTTARHSTESERKDVYPTTTPTAAPPILRSVSDQSERPGHASLTAKSTNGWRRRASAEASSSAASSGAGSDDTGWVTPKTSAGDMLVGGRRSISPALTATRRGSSGMDHYDETPHHTTTAPGGARRPSTVKQRRPVSYSSSAGTDSLPVGQQGRNGSFRYTHGPSHSASESSLWYDDTPKAASKSRPSLPTDFRNSMAAHPHRREASAYSTTGSTYSLDSLGTSSFAEAKRADKIDLFLRCTKAESALQAITAHSQIEREALLDALQESRAMIDALRQQNEELISELEHLRRYGARKPAVESQEAARRVAEIVEARDEWQARAQTMERDLAATKQAQAKNAAESEAALANMRQEINRLQEQLTATTKAPKSPARSLPRATSLPRKSSPGNSNNPLKISMSPSGLPRSTGTMKSSVSGLPRSRHSSGSNSIGFSPHGRTISNASSTFQTDFGDHLPASSDGWSLGDSQDASLRLDDSTARFLQDIDGHSVRSRQKSTTSSN